jgi:hypothetical protein
MTKDIEQLDFALRYVVDWQPWPREKTWKLRYFGPAHVRLTSIFIQQIQQPILDAHCSIHYLQLSYSNCAVYSTFVTVSDRGSQLAKSWEPHFMGKRRQEPCTVKPACNGTARDQTFDVTTSNVSFLRGSNTQLRDVTAGPFTAGPLSDVTSLQLSRQFIATIGTFEATRFFRCEKVLFNTGTFRSSGLVQFFA